MNRIAGSRSGIREDLLLDHRSAAARRGDGATRSPSDARRRRTLDLESGLRLDQYSFDSLRIAATAALPFWLRSDGVGGAASLSSGVHAGCHGRRVTNAAWPTGPAATPLWKASRRTAHHHRRRRAVRTSASTMSRRGCRGSSPGSAGAGEVSEQTPTDRVPTMTRFQQQEDGPGRRLSATLRTGGRLQLPDEQCRAFLQFQWIAASARRRSGKPLKKFHRKSRVTIDRTFLTRESRKSRGNPQPHHRGLHRRTATPRRSRSRPPAEHRGVHR